MSKSTLFFLFGMAFLARSFAQSDSLHTGSDTLEARVVLIGDAGELTNGRQPVVTGVRSKLALDDKTTVIFLGDNLYKVGLPDDAIPTYELAKAPLDSQIEISKGRDSKVYFIPGNHDWNNGSRNGYEAILREQRYVDLLGADKNVTFLPKDGCPGPVTVNLTKDIILLVMDSQWWLQPYAKPGIESDCPYKTKTEVLFQIKQILEQNPDKLIIFALHHTLRSYGIHGGYFTWKQYLFPFTDAIPSLYIPLPVIGAVYPITRSIFGTSEDLSHPLYQEMIEQLDSVVVRYKNVIFVAGHEHSLQLIKDMNHYYLVSGAGSKSTRVSNGKHSLYESSQNGFATLEISKNKTVRAKFFTVSDDFKVDQKYDSAILNFAISPTPEEFLDTARTADIVFKDSVLISASEQYKNPTGFKKFFLGENYRKEWGTPVKMKLFDIRTEKGGFQITGMGGGKQTRSLRLEDKNGHDWVLRTIDKDPEKAIPANLRGTLAQRIVQDLISASHPYAALVVPDLAHAAGVVEARPELFFVPDDPALGFYRDVFKGRVAMLEEREPTPGNANTISTAKTVNHLIEDHDDHIEQREYLKARLLDDLVGDWDRHFDQWKWGKADTGKGKLYYPVPRDRDQALFYSDGLLMNYVSKYRLRYVQSFRKTIRDITWLNWEGKDMDNIFLNMLDKEDWEKTIEAFQQAITDSVIASAVNKLPPPIYKMDAPTISSKLAHRRDMMVKNGMKWYRFLSKNVTVTGSNQRENFNIEKHDKGLELTVYKMKRYDTTGIMYHRIFDPSITKELRLFGLNGNDKFRIAPDVNSKIKVRIIGGKGKDTFDLSGNVRNYIYELKTENNGIVNARRSKIDLSTDPIIDEYRTNANEYNTYEFPHIRFGYNTEDFPLLGFGFSAKTFAFRKEPYATSQKFSALFALNNFAYQLKYEGIFNSVIFNKDLLVNAEFVNPTLNNFFGMGNETVYNKNLPLGFYRVRYKYVSTDVLLRKRLNEVVTVMAGPSYYHYWIRYNDNKSRILGKPSLIGSDSASIYSNKDYLGGKLKFDIDYVNDAIFPTRGITWYTEFGSMIGANDKSKTITKLTSDMTVYGSLNEERKVMGVFRVGAGKIYTKDFEYFQALNLGANNFIRGFRKNRFSGSAIAYGSLELRVKLFKSTSYILPGDVGVLGFYDVGRVWQYGQVSHQWHQAFGGGVYYIPYDMIILSATLGLSDEGAIFNFSIGTKFNITF